MAIQEIYNGIVNLSKTYHSIVRKNDTELYTIHIDNSTNYVYFQKSTDNGFTWTDGDGGGSGTRYLIYGAAADIASITYDSLNNEIYVFYSNNVGSPYYYVYCKKYSSGSWGSQSLVHGGSGGTRVGILNSLADTNGTVWINIRFNSNAGDCYYTRNGGSSWISQFSYSATDESNIHIDNSCNVHYTYRNGGYVFYAKFTWNGSSFTKTVDEVAYYIPGYYPTKLCIIERSGNIYIFHENSNVYMTKKPSGGSWSNVTQIITTTSSNRQQTCLIGSDIYLVRAKATNDIVYYIINSSDAVSSAIELGVIANTNSYMSINRLTNLFKLDVTIKDDTDNHYIYTVVSPPIQKTILSDTKIKVTDIQQTILSDSKIVDRYQPSLISDTTVKITNQQKNILSDTKIKSIDNQKTILSDTLITSIVLKTILSDTEVKIIDNQKTILSDSKIIYRYQPVILSDTSIKVLNNQQTILSNAKTAIQVLIDSINKVNIIKGILSDINNKVSIVIGHLSDISNFVNTCKSTIYNIQNDFRTKKLTLNNITNDIRFLYGWQKAVDGSLQSLGKSYIKVYIASIEQTDVDINSINISKGLDNSHTASFNLSRAYDSTKPAMESTVLIKYDNWTLFSGYITNISPTAEPENIAINCQNEHWKQNKSNVYYRVGHKPTDNKELYYETSKLALTTEHGWTPGIGNFVPQEINNFAVGKSEAITNLIREAGNYGWFYDIDGTKKLWTAGEGSVININRQVLGANIKLYDLIKHSFSENVENLVNKFRVQMGDKVKRKFNSTGGNRQYESYNFSNYQGFLISAWDSFYEKRAISSLDGYGWDYPEPGYEKEYGDVFKKYTIPYLNPEESSWSDRYPPKILVHNPGGYYYTAIAEMTEGFSIDYENAIVTFNQPQFCWQTNEYGEVTAIRRPVLELCLWKKNYYTSTNNPSDDPTTDISNPLMFFTDKMGDYPETILKDLSLSNLSIQIGRGIGGRNYIPSWDDTNFAKDYANWELSKNCDIKIKGDIELTLDCICFYGIDLTKRIYIAGITDEPMNIVSMSYNLSNFTVTLTLENNRYFNRTVSFQNHGE